MSRLSGQTAVLSLLKNEQVNQMFTIKTEFTRVTRRLSPAPYVVTNII